MDQHGQVSAIPPPGPASVAAVIVTFHPSPSFKDGVLPLLDQVNAIVVVDNGSCPGELPAGDDPTLQGRVEVIVNSENRGLATALNQGLRRASELGFSWALTLDQDSSALPNLVAAAARAFEAHPHRERLAAIGARAVGAEDPTAAPGRRRGSSHDPTSASASASAPASAVASAPASASARAHRTLPAVITSGTLHSIPAWERLGGFREDFFIDCIDTEFCLRARARGLEVIQTTEPALAHRIGIPSRKWVLGRWMLPTNHSPLRRYYVTRNRISFWRTYARTDGRFVLKDMRQCLREWIGIVFAESDRAAKLRAILAGVRDAALGRYGPRRLPRSPH